MRDCIAEMFPAMAWRMLPTNQMVAFPKLVHDDIVNNHASTVINRQMTAELLLSLFDPSDPEIAVDGIFRLLAGEMTSPELPGAVLQQVAEYVQANDLQRIGKAWTFDRDTATTQDLEHMAEFEKLWSTVCAYDGGPIPSMFSAGALHVCQQLAPSSIQVKSDFIPRNSRIPLNEVFAMLCHREESDDRKISPLFYVVRRSLSDDVREQLSGLTITQWANLASAIDARPYSSIADSANLLREVVATITAI